MNTSIVEYTPENLELDQRVANVFIKSGMFSDTESLAQAVIKIMAGREVGLGPFASMRGVRIIKGQPTYSAGLIAEKIANSGRYAYRVESLTDEECQLGWFEVVDGKRERVGTSTFSMADAQRAGLAGKDVWRKYPQDLLFARALTAGARRYAPGAMGTVYTAEELDGPYVPPNTYDEQHALAEANVTERNFAPADKHHALTEAIYGTDEPDIVEGDHTSTWDPETGAFQPHVSVTDTEEKLAEAEADEAEAVDQADAAEAVGRMEPIDFFVEPDEPEPVDEPKPKTADELDRQLEQVTTDLFDAALAAENLTDFAKYAALWAGVKPQDIVNILKERKLDRNGLPYKRFRFNQSDVPEYLQYIDDDRKSADNG